MPNWIYEKSTGRYRVTREGADSLGLRPGTFISQKRRIELRDEWTKAQTKVTDRLAIDYDNGKISLSEWVKAMREENRINYVEQYLLGHGGRNNMTPADWGRIGRAVRTQNEFLQKFAQDLMNKEPPLTLAQIQARARLYVDGSTSIYERATALAKGLPDLPEYPADGNQICKSGCKCHWDYEEFDDHWECTWILEPAAEHCDTCTTNASKWNPLVILK